MTPFYSFEINKRIDYDKHTYQHTPNKKKIKYLVENTHSFVHFTSNEASVFNIIEKLLMTR
jgi:hypothetical protein